MQEEQIQLEALSEIAKLRKVVLDAFINQPSRAKELFRLAAAIERAESIFAPSQKVEK